VLGNPSLKVVRDAAVKRPIFAEQDIEVPLFDSFGFGGWLFLFLRHGTP
jgi:hypothetical protein